MNVDDRFGRVGLLAGDDMMERLRACRVIIFGVGGVGSWCAEALARTAIGHITLVDSDTVALSNINRQLPALSSTVGRPKVEVMAERMRDINPDAVVEAIEGRYTPDTAAEFGIDTYDYCIDAIDSLPDKADLIMRCTTGSTGPRRAFFSSMGAARKLTPAAFRTAEFYKVEGCPLARALRTWFRRHDQRPGKFTCVYSPERAPHRAPDAETGGPNGTFVHATAVAGLTLTSLVVNDLY